MGIRPAVRRHSRSGKTRSCETEAGSHRAAGELGRFLSCRGSRSQGVSSSRRSVANQQCMDSWGSQLGAHAHSSIMCACLCAGSVRWYMSSHDTTALDQAAQSASGCMTEGLRPGSRTFSVRCVSVETCYILQPQGSHNNSSSGQCTTTYAGHPIQLH